MATPLNLNTPELLVRQAMSNAFLLEKGTNPSSEDYAQHLGVLNSLIQFLITQGLKLFLWKDVPLTMVAGQQSYPITTAFVNSSTNPLQVREAYYLYQEGSQYPLTPFSWNEWSMLSTRSQAGTPVNFFVDKQATSFNFNLWPVPQADNVFDSVHILVRQRAPQILQLNEQIMFPTEWFIGLAWMLSHEISTGQSATIIARCEKMAAYYKQALEGFDVEDAPTQFQPDSRVGYAASRFR